MRRVFPFNLNVKIHTEGLTLYKFYVTITKIGDVYAPALIGHIAILFELVISLLVINYVNYTEIDWSTYMQQTSLFLKGELNYTNIKGDTGPCVYPAGHLYSYSILYFLTNRGTNIVLGQYLFYVLYILTMSLIFYIFTFSYRFPAIGLFLITLTSYRIHSIYMLRMFNDCIAMFFLYFSIAILVLGLLKEIVLPIDFDVRTPDEYPIYIFTTNTPKDNKSSKNIVGKAPKKKNKNQGKNKTKQEEIPSLLPDKNEGLTEARKHERGRILWFSAVVYSIGLSIKMNLLLFAPGIAAFVFVKFGFGALILTGTSVIAVQLCLAAPFFFSYPYEYIINAFNFGRVFLYKWTVNWKIIDEELFLNKQFHLILLGLHVFFLIFIAFTLWFKERGGLWKLLWSKKCTNLSIHDMLKAIFTSNLIGISFARSLHYQFYSWYYHSYVYLLLSERTSFEMENDVKKFLGLFTRISMIMFLEISWNTYPATPFSSAMVHILHLGCFILLYKAGGRRYPEHHHES